MFKSNFYKTFVSLFLVIQSCIVFGQTSNEINVTFNPPVGIEACGEEGVFEITVQNISENNFTGVIIDPALIDGQTIVGTPTVSSGSISGNSVFTLGNLASGTSVTVTYSVFSDCSFLDDVIATITDDEQEIEATNNVSVRYNPGTSTKTFTLNNSQTYNVERLFPELSFPNEADDLNVNSSVGLTEIRQIAITSQTGRFRNLNLQVDYSQVDGNVLNHDLVTLKIIKDGVETVLYDQSDASNTQLGNEFIEYGFGPDFTGDYSGFFGTDGFEGDLLLEETIIVRSCGANVATRYAIQWGCSDQICAASNNAQINSSISTVNRGTGGLRFEWLDLEGADVSLCSDITGQFARGKLTNTSVSGQDNAVLNLYSSAFNMTGYSIENIEVLNSDGITYVSIPLTSNNNIKLDNNANLNIDLDGINNGLDDVDNDGFFDDLPAGQSIIFRFEYSAEMCFGGLGGYLSSTRFYQRFGGQFIGDDICDEQIISGNQLGIDYRLNSDGSAGIFGLSEQIQSTTPLNMAIGVSRTISRSVFEGLNSDFSIDNNVTGANFKGELTLPSGIEIDLATPVTFMQLTGVELPVTIIELPVTDEEDLNGIKKYSLIGGTNKGTYNIKLISNCSTEEGDGGESGGLGDILWEYLFFPNSMCQSCSTVLTRDSYKVEVACNSVPCSELVSTTDFIFDRSTYGVEEGDYTYGTLEDATALDYNTISNLGDREQYDLHKFLIGDKVYVKLSGKVESSDITNLHTRIRYSGSHELFKVNSATLNISGVSTILTTGDFVNSGGAVLDLVHNGSLDAGTEYFVEMELEVNKELPQTGIIRVPGSSFFGEFYSLTSDNIESRCNALRPEFLGINENLEVYSFKPSIVRSGNVNCDSPHNLRFSPGLNISSVNFRAEFRELINVKSYEFDLPNGFDLNVTSGSPRLDYRVGSDVLLTSPSDFSQVGNHIVFNRSDKWRVIGDNYNNGSFYIVELETLLSPNCQIDIPNIFQINFNVDIEFGSNVKSELLDEYVSNTTNNFTVNLEETNTAITEGAQSTASWDITLCNNSTVTTAKNIWFALTPETDRIELQTSAFTVVNGERGFFSNFVGRQISVGSNAMIYSAISDGADNQIGTNQCKTIRVFTKYSDCIEDLLENVKLEAGWGCGPAPDNPKSNDYCAIDRVENDMKIRYKVADLGVTLNRINEDGTLASNTVKVCDEVLYELTYKSVLFADIDDLKFNFDLPTGVSLSNDMVSIGRIRNGSFVFTDFSGIGSNDVSINALEDGIITLRGTRIGNGGDFLKVRFRLKLECSELLDASFQTDPIKITASGVTNCGVDRIFPFTEVIPIEELENVDEIKISVRLDQQLTDVSNSTTKQAKATVFIENLLDEPLIQDANNSYGRFLGIATPQGVEIVGDGVLALNSFNLFSNQSLFRLPMLDLGARGTGVFADPIAIQELGLDINVTDQYDPTGKGPYIPITFFAYLERDLSCDISGQETQGCEIQVVTGRLTILLFIDPVICERCVNKFSPIPGERYLFGAWVKVDDSQNEISYEEEVNVNLVYEGSTEVQTFKPKGKIIDGWQRVESYFTIPSDAFSLDVKLTNESDRTVFIDDIRIHPYNSNMKTYVYDPISLRLWAELDENNYTMFYEYDEEGKLIRVKKETERGIKTLQENRNNISKQ